MGETDDQEKNWKYKYYEALDEQEKKALQWEEAEQLYRHGMGRLALISKSEDQLLNQRLEKLRRTLQGQPSLNDVNTLIEKVSERVKVLDELAQESGLATPVDILRNLLSSVQFPKSVQRTQKRLLKRLNAAVPTNELSDLVDEVASLLTLALSDKVEQPKPGLFSRLFGNTGQPDSTNGNGVEGAGFTAQLSYHQNEVLLSGVFSDLIDGMTFPPEYTERVQDIKETLDNGIEAAMVKPLTKGIVNLVVEARRQLEQEKQELEDFLQQLTSRLSDLDSMLEGAESKRRASLESGRNLDQMVKAQVSDIEQAVHESQELDQLKSNIQGSLESIRKHLSEQRHQEENRHEELEKQLSEMTERLHAMEQQTQTLKQKLEVEREQAITDPLTGAPNRLAYEKNMAQEYARWQRYDYDLSMLVMDIDFFKKINDNYGHKAGDRALKAIVVALQKHVRKTDFMARIGGEEFIIVLPETSLEQAKIAAEKIRVGIESSEFVYKGQPVPITISGGIAQFVKGDAPEDVYERADQALYRAKDAGRNRFHVAEGGFV